MSKPILLNGTTILVTRADLICTPGIHQETIGTIDSYVGLTPEWGRCYRVHFAHLARPLREKLLFEDEFRPADNRLRATI